MKCSDINECKEGNHNCDSNAKCANSEGGVDCTCRNGFEGDGNTCVDIDECSNRQHNCDDYSDCKNNDGSLVAAKRVSSVKVASARISMSARKAWITVMKMPIARTQKADSNVNVSPVSLETVLIAMMLTNACLVITTAVKMHNASI